jgi:hypothetical protein
MVHRVRPGQEEDRLLPQGRFVPEQGGFAEILADFRIFIRIISAECFL